MVKHLNPLSSREQPGTGDCSSARHLVATSTDLSVAKLHSSPHMMRDPHHPFAYRSHDTKAADAAAPRSGVQFNALAGRGNLPTGAQCQYRGAVSGAGAAALCSRAALHSPCAATDGPAAPTVWADVALEQSVWPSRAPGLTRLPCRQVPRAARGQRLISTGRT